ncbi:MAG: serine/threonine-protein kinase [bacterium]
MLPHPGDIFEHKYRIDHVLGKGSFAHVYKAVVDEIGRKVAIKILRPLYGEDGRPTYSEQLRQRFLREAKLLSELQDRHTIRLYDYGKSQDGLLFMIFEFVDGAPLADLIGAKMSGARVVSILKQVLSSLHEAHQHGIIHRDIKPANIMIYEYLGQTDCAKLLDFGVAKDVDATMQLTTRNMRIGTMRYMSPEQVRGEEVVPASDLYSLGLVAYEMLVGAKAIESDDMNVVSLFHMRPDPIVLPNIDVAPDLRTVVERMMSKSLADRFGTAAEVVSALDAVRLDLLDDDDLDDPPTLRAFVPADD